MAPVLGSYKGIKMPDIQVGDLVKYKKHIPGQRDKGVWLVVNVELDERTRDGELVTLKQGNDHVRLALPRELDKISSCR